MSKVCMNVSCGVVLTGQWKRGWPMKAGGLATLCYHCGTEYDNARFCERFHLNESGWRECKYCQKPVHCGCVVSKYIHECLDSGGISCIKCIRGQALKQSINKISTGISRITFVSTNQMNNNITPLTECFVKRQFTSSESFKRFSTCCTSEKDSSPSLKSPSPLSTTTEPNNNKQNLVSNLDFEPLDQQSLGFSILPTSHGLAEEKVPLFKTDKNSRQMVLKQLNKGMTSALDNRVGRPPGEGRRCSQVLPRFLPKLTDQEFLQMRDLNPYGTITPLFKKILCASDTDRLGRMILPKACAEAYFPHIDKSEGVPLKVRDMKGKEWRFQFRFRRNDNRMYALGGVRPFIKNMQLQAGDTVIFSRLDPEDEFVIVCRKATVPAESSALPNFVNGGALISTDNGNLQTPSVIQELKRTRNIGSKSKRLHMHSDDTMELKLTWEEAQEYLCPPLSKPTVVLIENSELEEYDEPPVFGKKTIFTTNAAKVQEQRVQCDSCFKWRKLPSDVRISSKWTCSDNTSDTNRCFCADPEEKGVKHLDMILKFRKGENGSEDNKSLVGLTTRHPRHRPGCNCIVCIQSPSGKRCCKSNCICFVCSITRRRSNTLMNTVRLRKKTRLAKQEIINQAQMMTESSNQNGQELNLDCVSKFQWCK